MKRILLATLLIACMWSCATATADWKVQQEHWFVVEIAGTRAGSMHTMLLTDGSNIQTATHMEMTLERGPVATTIRISSAFDETESGRPLVISSMQDMGKVMGALMPLLKQTGKTVDGALVSRRVKARLG